MRVAGNYHVARPARPAQHCAMATLMISRRPVATSWVAFAATTARYLRLTATIAVNHYASAAEVAAADIPGS